jgi:hypothetical protein
MDELTRKLDKSERRGANVVQDMQKRMQERVYKLVMTMDGEAIKNRRSLNVLLC